MSGNPEIARIVVSKLASQFVDLLPVTGLAISALDQNQRPSVIHATDAISARLEEMQHDLGEGPSFDAYSSASVVSVPQLSLAHQWPAFANGAEELAVGSMFVFPLMLGAVCMGSVMCYRTETGALEDVDTDLGVSLSRALSGPAFRRAIVVAENESPDGEIPIEARREVHQATGMMVGQLGVGATQAFSRLRAYAFSSGTTVQEVAHRVVTRRLDFSELSD